MQEAYARAFCVLDPPDEFADPPPELAGEEEVAPPPLATLGDDELLLQALTNMAKTARITAMRAARRSRIACVLG
ncbi:MAG: hypothetical protein JO242_19530 [Streptosporangiaceae bacterium]|nr:hypothetical protein [Streptosporangiaceae bacterium]